MKNQPTEVQPDGLTVGYSPDWYGSADWVKSTNAGRLADHGILGVGGGQLNVFTGDGRLDYTVKIDGSAVTKTLAAGGQVWQDTSLQNVSGASIRADSLTGNIFIYQSGLVGTTA